jgi:predicted enzyme related to lactoylglutathione lyase
MFQHAPMIHAEIQTYKTPIDTEELVKRAGGVVTRAAFSFAGGRCFHFRDPAGNELAAMQAL